MRTTARDSTAPMQRSEILRRIEIAVRSLDVGVTTGQLNANFLNGLNMALRQIGAPTVPNLDDEAPLFRAMIRLEAE